VLLVLAAASIGLRFAGYLLPVDYSLWQGRFFPTALFLFLFGIMAYRALPIAARLPKAFGWLVNAALLAAIVALPLTKIGGEPGRWLVYGGIAVALPFVFNAFKDIHADRWLGDLSYPIYLTHLIVVGFVLTFEVPMAMWAALAATLALSISLLLLVDEPIDRWRQRRLARVNVRLAEPATA
jgi:peptidoglycan/LPS O-acetylase OafA/YrhL